MKIIKTIYLFLTIILTWGISQIGRAAESIPYETIWDLSASNTEILLERATKEISYKLGSNIYFSVINVKIENEEKIISVCIQSPDNRKLGLIEFFLTTGLSSILNPNLSLMGRPELLLEEELKSKCSIFPKFGCLSKLEIETEYQGQGYSTVAMKIFNMLMDKFDVCCTFLILDSDKPYTASIYVKRGYEFTPNSIEEINAWAQKNQYITNTPDSTKSAIEKFLEDSRVIWRTPMMIRWKSGIY